MKLNRRFYDSSINLKNIPIERLVLGIVIGFFSALTIYSFFYVIREAFRVMSFGFANLPYIIQEKDRNLYNIFFAGLSVVFANSITINMLFSKPLNILSRRNPIRKRILNDQIFLSFNFIYWFTKMGLCFFVFSMCCLDFDFTPYVELLSTLLLLVLYLDSWKGLSSIFKKNRFKVQLVHLAVMVFLTMAISRIDIVDYHSIDELAIKSSPVYDLPHSDFHNTDYSRYNSEVHLKIELLENNELRITHYGKWASINEVSRIITAERTAIREELSPFLSVRISADKNIDLKYIKMVEAELYIVNQQKIIYDIYNDDLLTHRFESRGIEYRISPFILNFRKDKTIPIPPQPFNIDSIKPEEVIKVNVDKTIKINGKVVAESLIVNEFKKQIHKIDIFEYNYSENTKYQDFIKVLSCHYKAVYELRKQEQTIFKEYKHQYDEEYRNEQEKLKQKYPIRIMEKLNQ